MAADVAKSRVERFPGFHRSEFEKLQSADVDRIKEALDGIKELYLGGDREPHTL